MVKCPECEGSGRAVQETSTGPWPLYMAPDEYVTSERIECSTCDGTGSLTDLKMGILKASGWHSFGGAH